MVVTTCKGHVEDFQPCCCPHGEENEEFYQDMPCSKTKDEHPWSLLPTPPHSPKHEPFGPEGETMLDLKLFSDKLDFSQLHVATLSDESLQSNLIQDCMWSAPGLQAAGLIAPSEWSKAKPVEAVTSTDTQNTKFLKTTLDINTTECVDPAAVFPYPLNDHKVPAVSLGTETPSESESSDDDDLDNEDEEIDVVSVSDIKPAVVTTVVPKRKPILPASSSMSAQVAAMHNYSSVNQPPRRIMSYSAPHTPSHHHHIPSHHGHKRSRPFSSPGSPQPSSKKQKLVVSESDLKKVVQKLKMGCSSHHRTNQSPRQYSRNSSDSEDCEGKRAQHNVLERKRRNDLKSSFLRLRDHIPDISAQERAPKVVILKKAADYITGLTLVNKQMLAEREEQRNLQERLKRRLAALNRDLL